MAKTIDLDGEIADRITVLTLKEHRSYLKKELQNYKRGEEWLHPEDVDNNAKVIEAMNLIIKHFGG